MSTQSREIELSGLLRKITSEYELKASKKSISLHLDLPEKPVAIQTDPSHYERIVENLISNAIKYSPQGRRVWIELLEGTQITKTVVRDEGPGISPEDQSKLFGKFQKLSARPTGGESSNGLGLAIVKAFSDQIGAQIEVESQLGAGTEFALVLHN